MAHLTSVDASIQTIGTSVSQEGAALTLPHLIQSAPPVLVSITVAGVMPGPFSESVTIVVSGDNDTSEFVVALTGEVSGCQAGAADCDADFSNGCETNTQTSLCLLYTSPSPRDATLSRMPSSA